MSSSGSVRKKCSLGVFLSPPSLSFPAVAAVDAVFWRWCWACRCRRLSGESGDDAVSSLVLGRPPIAAVVGVSMAEEEEEAADAEKEDEAAAVAPEYEEDGEVEEEVGEPGESGEAKQQSRRRQVPN